MSHVSLASAASSGTTNLRRRARVMGVPKRCWCGAEILAKNSKSEANPYRCYYRCALAAREKLENDNHTFKWVEEALLNEIETLTQAIRKITTERVEHEKIMFEKIQVKLEKEIFERVEDELLETKSFVKKMMIVLVLGCMIIFGLCKLVV
ncbi:unnamed protein product [Cochlearia groenlandica]